MTGHLMCGISDFGAFQLSTSRKLSIESCSFHIQPAQVLVCCSGQVWYNSSQEISY